MKVFKYFFEAIFIYSFFIVIKIIGLKLSRVAFSFLFKAIGPLIRNKKIIENNLNYILTNYDEQKKNTIISAMWSNYGKTFVEYIYLKKFKKENKHIKILNEKVLEEILDKKKPVIFVSGHFANFELMSMELVKKGFKLSTIYRPLNNYFLNPFMEYVRRKYVCKNQIKKGVTGIRHAVDYLKKNFSVALMIDQRVSEGKSLPFFKKNALTTTLPAQLALKFDCEIVPIYINRTKDEKFEIEILEPIKFDKKDNSEENKLNITKNLNDQLERMILRDPSQWILTHNRWK